MAIAFVVPGVGVVGGWRTGPSAGRTDWPRFGRAAVPVGALDPRRRPLTCPAAPCHRRFLFMKEGGALDGLLKLPIPAYGYLALSSVLAIASVGCVFELGSGHPQHGVPLTSVILGASFPGFLLVFWLAIRKGRMEAGE
ncbi:hypothetical protein CDCA_CDCA01G0415 [Cyanidium caldarium]|uniref:Uncharacterized protein n=1 Tax=Cyanidium caldarium TaxID=2771 RepID=A0AAV9IQN5_CYACA|nr:hypothetical protein CDCA_CDCA01G0415 [Cyanidium caldarium]